MGSLGLCFAWLLKIHVICWQRICLLVSVLVHSVTSGGNDSSVDKFADIPAVCTSELRDCWNRQHSSGRTGDWLCHCALTLAGKRIVSDIWYDVIYLLTAIGLTPGGSSTVHCSKWNQRDAVQRVFYCTLVGSTCFGCRRHPSSGAQYVQSRSVGTKCVW